MTLFMALGAPRGMTTLLKIASRFSSAVVRDTHDLLLANSEAPRFRLTHYLSEGTEAWSNPCGNLGFAGGEIGALPELP
jgi:hypothetical protein